MLDLETLASITTEPTIDELLNAARIAIRFDNYAHADVILAHVRRLEAYGKPEPVSNAAGGGFDLPPGFEIREFEDGWYPCKDIDGSAGRVFYATDGEWGGKVDLYILTGDEGYPSKAAAYADRARWLKAAGVEVTT